MEVAAKLSGARISAQKARLVADQIRGKKVGEALNLLAFSSKKAAEIMKKVLESAVANAEHNEGADVDDLKVSTVFVNEGRSLKRIMLSPWGFPTKGAKTRGNKRTDKMIVRRRK